MVSKKIKIAVITIFTLLINCDYNMLYGQDESTTGLVYMGIETGVNVQVAHDYDYEFIREVESTNTFEYNRKDLKKSFYQAFVGIEVEYKISNILSITTGGRLTSINSSIFRKRKSKFRGKDNEEFFYFLVAEEGTNTQYARVKRINENTQYLGAPIELSFYPFEPKTFNLYFKLGGEVAFLLNSDIVVDFKNHGIDFNDEINEKLTDPENVFSSVYAAIGAKIGKLDKPSFGFEVTLPSYIISEKNSSLADPQLGVGLQLNFQLPL